MISKELHDKVVDIPGGDGWFHSAGQAMFVDIAKILLRNGISDEDTIDILENAYAAVAGEFGE